MNITEKTDIINYLGKKFNYSSFLEISSTTTGYAFDKIDNDIFTTKEILLYIPPKTNLCRLSKRHDVAKIPINYDNGIKNLANRKFDIVFVDPWHSFEQSKIDIDNAMKFVNDNGIIVVHDCNPLEFIHTGSYKNSIWCGQTYEAFIDFKVNNPTIESYVVNTDYGCGIIKKNSNNTNIYELPNNLTTKDVTKWNYFNQHRKTLLNLITVEEFIIKTNIISYDIK